MIDPNLPVAKLCMAGMAAEGKGNIDEANRCFTEAWDAASTDSERSIAAHYLARNQPDAQIELLWNERALACAQAAPESTRLFMPSLLGSVGLSQEKLGRSQEARRFMLEAKSHFDVLQDDAYGEFVRSMISQALVRLNS
jgi:hypothetical protein